MISASTFEKLKALNCSAMADEFQNQIDNSKSYNSLGFEERLGLMVDAEWNRRQSNKLARYIKIANFSIPSASIEGIEYHEDRKLDKAEILADLDVKASDILQFLFLHLCPIPQRQSLSRLTATLPIMTAFQPSAPLKAAAR